MKVYVSRDEQDVVLQMRFEDEDGNVGDAIRRIGPLDTEMVAGRTYGDWWRLSEEVGELEIAEHEL